MFGWRFTDLLILIGGCGAVIFGVFMIALAVKILWGLF